MEKKKLLLRIILPATLFFTFGCGLAPLSGLYTGRSVGKGDDYVAIGSIVMDKGTYPAGVWLRGLSENFDMGISGESLGVGLVMRYSLFNSREGFSWALTAGFGSLTSGGTYWYGGSVMSLKFKSLEPFISARYFETNFIDVSSVSVPGQVTITLDGKMLKYPLYSAGLAYWFTDKFGLMAEYTVFGPINGATANSDEPVGMPWLSILFNY